jgi:hypothetical protein
MDSEGACTEQRKHPFSVDMAYGTSSKLSAEWNASRVPTTEQPRSRVCLFRERKSAKALNRGPVWGGKNYYKIVRQEKKL